MAHIGMVLRGDIRYDGRVRKEIATLVRAGHHVELVVSDFSKTASGGEDLGVKIHYLPMTHSTSALQNLLGHVLFNRRAAGILKQLAPSHIHCHDLYTLLAGVWAKRVTQSTLVFDAHELMPESMGGIRERIWGWIEKGCITSCDHIIMPEKNRISYFQKKYPKVPDVLLLHNFPRKSDIPNGRLDLFRDIYSIRSEQKIILYTGLIAPKRNVEELVESMTLCSDDFVLVILGKAFKGYEETLRVKIKQLDLSDRVFIHGAVPYTKIIRYMASCDIGTAFYQNININNYFCASNKLYEYIALDKIVLTNDYPGLVESVGMFEQGICLRELTAKSLAQAYIHASDCTRLKPGFRKFFWEDEEGALIRLYDSGGSAEPIPWTGGGV